MNIKNGSHLAFINEECSPKDGYSSRGSYKISIEEQHILAARSFVSWFNYYLKGDANYYTYIFGQRADEDSDKYTKILVKE